MSVLYVVTVEVEPSALEQFRAWLPHHVEAVLAQPGFVGCRSWLDAEDAADGWRRVHNHYELRDRESHARYDASEAAARLRSESRDRFGANVRFRRALYSAL